MGSQNSSPLVSSAKHRSRYQMKNRALRYRKSAILQKYLGPPSKGASRKASCQIRLVSGDDSPSEKRETAREGMEMLSDALFDAVQNIKRYRDTFPDIYRRMNPKIYDILHRMEIVRVYLDNPDPHLSDAREYFKKNYRVESHALKNPHS